jgi:copper transport protein
MRPMLALIVLAIVAGQLCGATPLRAHAALVETEPAADDVLEQAPNNVAITFSEPVRPIVVRLIDGQGDVLADESTARVAGNRIELPVEEALPAGGYIVSWRVISADSHPMGGSFRFAVGSSPNLWRSDEAARSVAINTWFWGIGLGIARTLHLAGLLVAAGGIWYALLVAPDRPRLHRPLARIVTTGAGIGIVGVLVGFGMEGGLLLAGDPSALLDRSTWQVGLSTPIGQMQAASAIMLGIAGALARRSSHVLASVAAILAIAPLGLAGHVAMAEPRWFTGPSLILHVTLAAFWLGSLPPLLLALGQLPGLEAAVLLKRFSNYGVGAVAALVLAGAAIAAIQLGRVAALWATSYGIVLATKLILVAGLMLIALANKLRLTPALAANRPGAAARLIGTIKLEIVLIGAVLALTASLGFTTPPRALKVAEGHDHGTVTAREPAHRSLEHEATAAGVKVTLSLSHGRPGPNILSVSLEDEGGDDVDARQVQAHLASAEHILEPITRSLSADGDRFTLQTSDMALPGIWQIRIDVLVTDFDRASFDFEVDIR